MPLEIKFEAPNMARVEASLTALGNIDFTQLWPLFREQLFAIEAEMFASQGATGMHGEWDALEPAYAARKERKWAITEIERASGRSFYSLTGETADSVFESTRDAMTFGTRVSYALFQQTGFRTRLGKAAGLKREIRKHAVRHESGRMAYVAPRRLFDLTDDDVRKLERVAHQWYIAKARRAGFKILGRGTDAAGALAAGRKALGEYFPPMPLSDGM